VPILCMRRNRGATQSVPQCDRHTRALEVREEIGHSTIELHYRR
jgi:hypothetical protein